MFKKKTLKIKQNLNQSNPVNEKPYPHQRKNNKAEI